MCNYCNSSTCTGCNPCTYQAYASFPPPAGPVGPQGPIGPVGPGAATESGGFSRTVANGSGTAVINTVSEVLMLFLTATETIPATGSGSQGIGSPLQNSCIADDSGLITLDPANSIRMVVGGNGFTAVITAIASQSFSVTWTMVGAGADVTVNWQAIVKA